MDITINHFLAVSAVLFAVGVVGIFVNRKNIIVILMALERQHSVAASSSFAPPTQS